MAQVKNPGTGSKTFNSNQVLSNITYETIAYRKNRLLPMKDSRNFEIPANTTFKASFIAEDNGFVGALRFSARNVAANATVGGRFVIDNLTAGTEMIDYGIGGATNSNAADAQTTTLAANGVLDVVNPKTESATTRFNRGDNLQITFTPDGTTWLGDVEAILEYKGQGR